MLKLNELKYILQKYNIHPSKRLGQNFLIDKNIQKKIIEGAEITKNDTVLEIGPGLGALTEELCKRAKRVIAIEKDRRLYNFLLRHSAYDNLEILHADILKHDFNAHTRLKVIGNLPYYISSPMLIRLLENSRSVTSIFITVQKEFAERLVARPGSKAYGSISCFVQFYAEPKILFTIKKNAFYPSPKVDSSVLKIDIRKEGLFLTDTQKLFKIIRAAFGKRRKTILNSLCSSKCFGPKEDVLEKLRQSGILPSRRPETISLQEFVRLSQIL